MGGEGAMKKRDEEQARRQTAGFPEILILADPRLREMPAKPAEREQKGKAAKLVMARMHELGERFSTGMTYVQARAADTQAFCEKVAEAAVTTTVEACVELVRTGNGTTLTSRREAADALVETLASPPPAVAAKPRERKKPEQKPKEKPAEQPKIEVIVREPKGEGVVIKETIAESGKAGLVTRETPGEIDTGKDKVRLGGMNSESGEREKVLAETREAHKKSEKDFVIVDRMVGEYAKGNYDAVLALDAVAKRDKDAAYALATSDRLMVIATMIMQQRRQPQDTFFSGMTFAFTGIGVRNYGLAAGEPTEEGQKNKEEMRTAEAKASAETREYAAQAAAIDTAIAQVLAQLPAIAEAQGLEIQQATGPFTHVEITIAGAPRQETPSARQSITTPVLPEHLAPDFAPVLAKAPKIKTTPPTTRTPAPVERETTTVAKEEPKKFGGVAKTKPAKEGGTTARARKPGEESEAPKLALTLSPEEQRVYAAAVERLQELVEEGTKKTAGKKVGERKPKAA